MKKTALWTLPLAFLLAFGLGYVVGESAQKSPIEIPAAVKQEAALASQPGTNLETLGLINTNTLLDQILEEQTVFKMLAKTYALVGNMDQRSLEALIRDAAVHDNELINRNVMTIGIRRLSEIDPHATMMLVLDNPELPTQGLSQLVAGNWLRIDPEGVVSYVVSLHNDRLQRHLASRLYGDPLLVGTELDRRLEPILGTQSVAIAQNKSLRSSPPSDAFELALSVENHNNRFQFLHQAVRRWAQDDPSAAVKRVLQLEESNLRNSLLNQAFVPFAAENFNAAAEIVRSVQDKGQLISALASVDPVRALPLAESIAEQSGEHSALRSVVMQWAQRDLGSALTYIDRIDENNRHMYESQILSMLSFEDPQRAYALAETWVESNPQIVQNLFHLNGADPDLSYAKVYIEQTTNEVFKAGLAEGIVQRMSIDNPTAALAWINRYKGDPIYNKAAFALASNVVQDDPYLAAEALLPLLDVEHAYYTMDTVAEFRYLKDPEEAIEWVESLPESIGKDGAIRGLVQMLAHYKPEDAPNYLTRIPEGFRREEAKVMVAMGYIQEAKLSIDDIVTELDLSGATEEKVRTQARAYAANNND